MAESVPVTGTPCFLRGTKTIMKRRLISLDLLRCVAILLVTGFHVARWMQYDLTFINPLNTVLAEGVDTGVALFFMLSGYCLTTFFKERTSYWRFIVERFVRIVPTYYMAIIVWCFLVASGITAKPIGLKHVLSHACFVHTLSANTFYSVCGVFWYLGVLAQLYLIFPFLLVACRKTAYGLVCATVPFVLALWVSIHFHIDTPVFTRCAFFQLPVFVGGMVLALHPLKIPSLPVRIILCALAVSCMFIVFPGRPGVVSQVKAMFLFFSVVQFDDVLQTMRPGISDMFSFISKASFSIYLYNYIFFAYSQKVRNGTVFLCAVAMVVGFGIVMHVFVERPLAALVRSLRGSKWRPWTGLAAITGAILILALVGRAASWLNTERLKTVVEQSEDNGKSKRPKPIKKPKPMKRPKPIKRKGVKSPGHPRHDIVRGGLTSRMQANPSFFDKELRCLTA